MTIIKSATEIIDALGGNIAVAALTSTTPKAVSNWRAYNKFPSNTYQVIKDALAQQDKTAPGQLWSMREPPATASRRKRCA